MPSERLDYEVVDVFTSRAFAGNPLAVVYGADRLSAAQLAAIAREFNLSETAFPVERTVDDIQAGAAYRLRIFTPGGEIPFAGHPTVGAAWALHRRGIIMAGEVVQACGAGLIGVTVPADLLADVWLTATPRDQARRLSDVEADVVAGLVGLSAADVLGPVYTAGTGLSWVFLRVSRDAVGPSRPQSVSLSEAGVDMSAVMDPIDGINVYAVDSPETRLEVSSRVFVPGLGVPEDPATGSAAAGLGLVLVASGLAHPDGETAYRITQGVEMGRPSLLLGRVESASGLAVRVHVGGMVRPVASGTIAIPPLG